MRVLWQVRAAVDHELRGRHVAIKEVHRVGDGTGADCRRAQLALEITLLRQAVDHPCVVHLLDALQKTESVLLVFERITGPDLSEVVLMRGSLPEADVQHLGRQLLSAIQHLHRLGVPPHLTEMAS